MTASTPEPLVLGIETSCDETGIGIVRGRTLLSNTIASSMDEHARFGGVVPEVAARAHLEALGPAIRAAVAEAGIDLADLDAVAVTSANALRHASPSLLAGLAKCPLYAVGKATAETAREAGFLDISVGPGDADGLARLISDRLGADATVAYLCGRLRRPDFEEGLRQHGIRPAPVETYDTLTARIGKDAVRRLGTAPFFTVLVHSAEAAKALATLAPDPAFVPLLANARLVAISRRAAEPAAPLFPERIVIAEEPTDRAMAAALSGLL